MQAGIYNTQFKFTGKICVGRIADIYRVACQEWLTLRDAAGLSVSS